MLCKSRELYPLQAPPWSKNIAASTNMTDKDPILQGKYPAKAHCEKVAAYLKDKASHDGPTRIYLQGQKTRMIEDNDEPQPFRSANAHSYSNGFFQRWLISVYQTASTFLLPLRLCATRLSSCIPCSHVPPHTVHPTSRPL